MFFVSLFFDIIQSARVNDGLLTNSINIRSVDTDTFARVHSNARTVHPL